MKLEHLPLGARFEYNGKVFVKTGPITAAAEAGGQQMIPRYAVLRPLDPPPAEKKEGPRRKVDAAAVRTAFDDFYRTCLRSADDFSRPELEAARRRFLAVLE